MTSPLLHFSFDLDRAALIEWLRENPGVARAVESRRRRGHTSRSFPSPAASTDRRRGEAARAQTVPSRAMTQ
ncbi:hypothetical protein E2562_008301 [Oryza meyeriana var. granulata]|uniref:Uncharacterized protein n=1 Tax=Oryza meyeriana var. granulata TaxID=110450 RepID=A0A6G1DG82_9ORYZ|nr:hypothetical protein E2562_008301 [Oryza meyeriana var. granulata]